MNTLDVSGLTEEDLRSFESVVSSDIKNTSTQDDIDYLKDNLDLWLYCLLSMKRTAEYNLSSRTANKKINLSQMRKDNEPECNLDRYIIAEEKWRVNTVKFLSVLERKILYVKILIKQSES